MMIVSPQSRPAGDREGAFVGRNWYAAEEGHTKVTVCSGTYCKLYDLVREGELLARRGRTLRG